MQQVLEIAPSNGREPHQDLLLQNKVKVHLEIPLRDKFLRDRAHQDKAHRECSKIYERKAHPGGNTRRETTVS